MRPWVEASARRQREGHLEAADQASGRIPILCIFRPHRPLAVYRETEPTQPRCAAQSARLARRRVAVHIVVIHVQVAQHGRCDVDERARAPPWAGEEAAALDHQKWPLLVGAEPAMLAK